MTHSKPIPDRRVNIPEGLKTRRGRKAAMTWSTLPAQLFYFTLTLLATLSASTEEDWKLARATYYASYDPLDRVGNPHSHLPFRLSRTADVLLTCYFTCICRWGMWVRRFGSEWVRYGDGGCERGIVRAGQGVRCLFPSTMRGGVEILYTWDNNRGDCDGLLPTKLLSVFRGRWVLQSPQPSSTHAHCSI